MKRFLGLPLLFLLSSFELITDYSFVDKKHPVHFEGEFRNVFPAEFRTHSVKGSHVNYQDAHAFLYYSHYLTPDNSLSWKAGYSFLDFDWKKNPRFTGDDYHFASASLGWVSTSLKDWRWILSGAVSVDTKTWNFGQSGVYYGLMWGRYQFLPNLGMHVGWAGYVGVKNGYILPILGLDWKASKHIQVNGIFPINVSIEYLFDSHFSACLMWATFGRPYRFPMRAHGGIGDYKNGIFEVYSKGLELDFKFKTGNAFSASIGGGWNFGGWIFIKDSHNHHGKYYKFDDAPYIQGQITATF
ncbi:MAG: hypothetical protein HYZ48_05215 [Chlamydiales bacterium]|nr:hypothetical protein [Chlamydiales bacterium]